ncbi:MAG: hypothetical protein IKV79_01930 [Oscillospiraceae bacterium]|nr:hypothetical protein [Oscillospiraceae bacterium]
MQRPIRKHPRLKDYDYSQDGAYFVTVCTKNRAQILSSIVGRGAHTPPPVELSNIGKSLDRYISNIENVYSNIFVDAYVIMPNHFHILIRIGNDNANNGGVWAPRPTDKRTAVQTVLRSLKTMVTKETGMKDLWQTSFYDHVIRSEQDYLACWQYIDDNPAKWTEDKYFV